MGDKLGGDYIFDITYIRRAYTGLYDTLTESLASFDVLTQNKYPRLKDVFGRIDNEIGCLYTKTGKATIHPIFIKRNLCCLIARLPGAWRVRQEGKTLTLLN